MPLISASQLAVNRGELEVFSALNLEVAEKARIGLVGPNGGGKTTLLRVLVGEHEPDAGSVSRARGMRVGYVSQTQAPATGGSLRDDLLTAFDDLREIEAKLGLAASEMRRTEGKEQRRAEAEYASLLARFEALGGYDYENRMERVASGVGLSTEDLRKPAASASGGERTRAALAQALLAEPHLLVLDEATNYLDFKGLAWLERFLGRFSGSFIAVSHDRYFLDRVVGQVWELDHGRLKAYRGNYSKYRALKDEQANRQQKEFDRQQERIAGEEAFIRRYGAGQRAREAKGRAKKLARLDRVDAPEAGSEMAILGTAASRTGRVVLETRGLRIGFADGPKRTELLSVPDVKLESGSRTAVVGPNGTGKTTLLRTILGQAPALAGVATLGHNVKVAYHRQVGEDLPMESTVLEAMQEVRNIPIGDERSYLARYLFVGDDVFKPVAALSGGERTRLAVARMLALEPNFLVLDEPTTHLDIPSREALEQSLTSFGGTILLVSHDRPLISLLAERLWVIDEGRVSLFPGAFDEWERENLGPPPAPVVGRRSSAAKGRAAASKKASPAVPSGPSPEEVISGLEDRLGLIERDLAEASERMDVTEVARLGERHEKTRARLERAWRKWGA